MVPENAAHMCAFTKTYRAGSWANECPDKCFEVMMTSAEWRQWVFLMAKLEGSAPL